jgi:DNA-binding NarL/FixJ family response regulator
MPVGRLLSPRARRARRVGFRPFAARPVRVLVVEPAAENRERICRLGRQACGTRCEWIEATNLRAAVQMLAANAPDLVIANSRLFEESFDWLKAAAPSSEQTAFVAILGSDEDPQQIQNVLDAGVECLLSPDMPEAILETELRGLVLWAKRRLANPDSHPIVFPKGNYS